MCLGAQILSIRNLRHLEESLFSSTENFEFRGFLCRLLICSASELRFQKQLKPISIVGIDVSLPSFTSPMTRSKISALFCCQPRKSLNTIKIVQKMQVNQLNERLIDVERERNFYKGFYEKVGQVYFLKVFFSRYVAL